MFPSQHKLIIANMNAWKFNRVTAANGYTVRKLIIMTACVRQNQLFNTIVKPNANPKSTTCRHVNKNLKTIRRL